MEEKDKDIEKTELYVMNIIDDGKQLSIRIPAKIAEALQIDAEKDAFLFLFNKKELSLDGKLISKELTKKK